MSSKHINVTTDNLAALIRNAYIRGRSEHGSDARADTYGDECVEKLASVVDDDNLTISQMRDYLEVARDALATAPPSSAVDVARGSVLLALDVAGEVQASITTIN